MHGFIPRLSNLFYCVSPFVPLQYYFDNCSVVISFEVRKPVPPSFVFLSQDCLVNSGVLHLHTNLKKAVCSISIKNVVGILKKSYTMTKWALSQECKDSLISANQSM